MNKNNTLLNRLHFITQALIILTIVTFIFDRLLPMIWLRPISITLFTSTYHFTMRLGMDALVRKLPDTAIQSIVHIPKPGPFLSKIYRILHVKQWKHKVMTARPEDFTTGDIKQLLLHMKRSLIGHILMMVLSFVPLLFTAYFGAGLAFLITSILSCLLEVPFIIIQCYNIPRVEGIIRR